MLHVNLQHSVVVKSMKQRLKNILLINVVNFPNSVVVQMEKNLKQQKMIHVNLIQAHVIKHNMGVVVMEVHVKKVLMIVVVK